MEADEPVLVVGLHHQENDRRNDGDVGQHSGHIVGHASGAEAAWGTAGAVATLPAQAAQVVVPSAICAPHILQKAIEFLLASYGEVIGALGCNLQLRKTAAKRRCGKVPKSLT